MRPRSGSLDATASAHSSIRPVGRRTSTCCLPGVDPRAGVVLDIGANEGDWTASLLQVFPESVVIAAEPGSEPRAMLERRFADAGYVRIDPRAVSDLPGPVQHLVGEEPVSVLKLDVQGGELAVLRSGRRVLENTAAVLVEVLFLPHYEGYAIFPDLHKSMTEIGFTLIDLSAPFHLDGGPALWADACYARLPGA